MEIATWRGLKRLAQLALCGIGAAFAVALLSLLLAPSAHASDEDQPTLLGAVGGILNGTTDLVGSTVTGVTDVATETVQTVVSVAPAPVQQPVAVVTEVVQTAVVQPVQQVTSSNVVSTVTQPVVEAVTAVPVVGEVVTALGADDLVTQVGTSVDTTLQTVVTTLDTTVESLTPVAPAPLLPTPAIPLPSLEVGEGTASTVMAPAADAAATSAEAAASTLSSTVARPVALPSLSELSTSPTATSSLTAIDVRGSTAPPASGPCASTLASLGSGGAGPGAWAFVALLPFAAHRAWVRRAGPEDDQAPPAPAASTDVSPD